MSLSDVPPMSFPLPLRVDGTPDLNLLEATRDNPVLRVSGPTGEAWLVAGEQTAREVLSEPDRFSSVPDRSLTDSRGASAVPMIAMDPPGHTRLRRLASKVFTARRVQSMVPEIERLVSALLDDMESAGPPADLVSKLAVPLPMSVIFTVLGEMPKENPEELRRWSVAFTSLNGDAGGQAADAVADFHAWISDIVRDRRRNLGDDLLSDLVRARDGQDAMTVDELIATVGLMIVAGHETSAKAITRGVMVLVASGQWARVVAGELPADRVAEEVLRHQPPIDTAIWRTATVDTELAGQRIKAGEQVLVSLNLANYDPAVRHNPEVFDPERADPGHLTFGFGPHFCLGATLARAELIAVFRGMATRFPRMSLAVPPGSLRWTAGSILNAPINLPVRW